MLFQSKTRAESTHNQVDAAKSFRIAEENGPLFMFDRVNLFFWGIVYGMGALAGAMQLVNGDFTFVFDWWLQIVGPSIAVVFGLVGHSMILNSNPAGRILTLVRITISVTFTCQILYIELTHPVPLEHYAINLPLRVMYFFYYYYFYCHVLPPRP